MILIANIHADGHAKRRSLKHTRHADAFLTLLSPLHYLILLTTTILIKLSTVYIIYDYKLKCSYVKYNVNVR